MSDAAIDVLTNGKINHRLFCELITHKNFRCFLVDAEIYVDRIADMRINNMNAVLEVLRENMIQKEGHDENDLMFRTVEVAQVDEDEYFAHLVHKDIDTILRDIRNAHKTDSMTADEGSTVMEARKQLQEALGFEGSDTEKQLQILCGQLGIPYDKLTQSEFKGMISALQKSKLYETTKRMREKGTLTHGKGNHKRK